MPYTPEEMRRRITLWAGMSKQSSHLAAVYMRKLFVEAIALSCS